MGRHDQHARWMRGADGMKTCPEGGSGRCSLEDAGRGRGAGTAPPAGHRGARRRRRAWTPRRPELHAGILGAGDPAGGESQTLAEAWEGSLVSLEASMLPRAKKDGFDFHDNVHFRQL